MEQGTSSTYYIYSLKEMPANAPSINQSVFESAASTTDERQVACTTTAEEGLSQQISCLQIDKAPVTPAVKTVKQSVLGNLISHELREVRKRPTYFCFKSALNTIMDHFVQIPVSQWKDYFKKPEAGHVKKGFIQLKFIYIEVYHGILAKGGGAGVKNEVMQHFRTLFHNPVTFYLMQYFCVKIYEARFPALITQQMQLDLGDLLSNITQNKSFERSDLVGPIEIPANLVKYFPGTGK